MNRLENWQKITEQGIRIGVGMTMVCGVLSMVLFQGNIVFRKLFLTVFAITTLAVALRSALIVLMVGRSSREGNDRRGDYIFYGSLSIFLFVFAVFLLHLCHGPK